MPDEISYYRLAPVNGLPWPRRHTTREEAEDLRKQLKGRHRILAFNAAGKIISGA